MLKITLQFYLLPLSVLCILHGQVRAQSANPTIEDCHNDPIEIKSVSDNRDDFYQDLAFFDQLHQSNDLCETAVDLSILASTPCSGGISSIDYELSLDLNGDGLTETIVSSSMLPPAGIVYFGNANGQTGVAANFDKNTFPFRFGIELIDINGKKQAKVRFTKPGYSGFTNPQLPLGSHQIKWTVVDHCGNTTICNRSIYITDGKKPWLASTSGLNLHLLPNQTIDLWITDALQFSLDNCTPDTQLVNGICRNCTSFPYDSLGNPIEKVKFTCDDLGIPKVKLWSVDRAGNTSTVEQRVVVIATNSTCPNYPKKEGYIYSAYDAFVSDPSQIIPCLDQINIDVVAGWRSFLAPYLPTSSSYSFRDSLSQVGVSVPITIKPQKNDNYLMGVDMLDVLKIQQHILGIEPLSSPYKIVAADVNNSRSVTSSDIVELRKLILGANTVLPNVKSYRFILESHQFSNPNNPFTSVFPESVTFAPFDLLQTNLNFLGFKVGDVTGNSCDLLTTSDDRTSSILHVEDRQLTKGQTFEVPITTHDALVALQATWQFDGLELLEIIPGSLMSDEDFHVLADGQTCSMAWIGEEIKPAWAFRFRANRSGYLSDMLALTDAVTPTRAYTQDEQPHAVGLRFDASAIANANGNAPILYGNRPNPFGGETEVRFYLPKAQKVKMNVFNALGQEKYTHEAWLEAGMQSITLNALDLGEKGILHCVLTTEAGQQYCKMVAE